MFVTLCSQCATGLSERHFLQLLHEMFESSEVGVPVDACVDGVIWSDEDPLGARHDKS